MKRNMFLFILSVLFISTVSTAQEFKIKFATLAPEGSTWMDVMREFDQAVREESGGRLGFKIYSGGVLGDEKDVLRKIRLGQLHSAGFTGVGLGEILPQVRILDSPLLFRNYNEVDYVNNKFYNKFARAFEEKGYVLLGWAEVGFVYIFSNRPIQKLEDIKGIKMWMWEGDPLAEAAFKTLGLTPVPLSVIDVMTALQTKMIEGVYNSPLGALALQWFTKVKYMMEVPFADAAGAILISKKMYNKLPPDLQEILLENGRKYMRKLVDLSRKDNTNAIETLKQQGIIVTPAPSKEVMEQLYEDGGEARRMLVGKLYSQELLDEVENVIDEYRRSHER